MRLGMRIAAGSPNLAQLVEQLLQTTPTLGKVGELVLYQHLLCSHSLAQQRCGLTSVLGDLEDVLPLLGCLVCLHRVSLLILPHGLLLYDFHWVMFADGDAFVT